MRNPSDLTPQLRAAVVAWHIADGDALRCQHVAQLTGLCTRDVHLLMRLLVTWLPITWDATGAWVRSGTDARGRQPCDPQARAAVVAWRLACGKALRTCDVVGMCGMHELAAQRLLNEMSFCLPIYRNDYYWQRCEFKELVE